MAFYCCFTRTTLFTKRRCAGCHGFLSVCKVSFLNSVWFFEIRELKLKKNNNKMKDSENELLQF